MEKVERPVLERRTMALALRSGARGGDRVIELRGVDFDPVLIDVSLTVMRGERIGIVRPNAPGKTVLAKLLTGDLRRTEGERRAGERARASTRSSARGSSRRRPSCCRSPRSSARATSASTAAAIPTSSPARRSRSARASSLSATPSTP
jgi:ATPase subunit of ABC transporter with duplicated ATPase domains